MDQPAQIRNATAQDVPALQALYTHLIPEEAPAPVAIGQDRLAALSAYPHSAILVAERAGTLVATVTLIVVPNMTRQGAPYAFIENVVTHAEHRDQGLAKVLLAEAEARAWSAGCYRIMIVSGNHNKTAHATYAAAGYAASKTGFQKRRIADRAPQAQAGLG